MVWIHKPTDMKNKQNKVDNDRLLTFILTVKKVLQVAHKVEIDLYNSMPKEGMDDTYEFHSVSVVSPIPLTVKEYRISTDAERQATRTFTVEFHYGIQLFSCLVSSVGESVRPVEHATYTVILQCDNEAYADAFFILSRYGCVLYNPKRLQFFYKTTLWKGVVKIETLPRRVMQSKKTAWTQYRGEQVWNSFLLFLCSLNFLQQVNLHFLIFSVQV